jgi:hypothetical protein
MSFENDIFISYAHIDNHPLTEGQEGWISEFHRTLEIRLAQLRGEKPKIWRDLKLQGNDFFADTIVEQFPKVALLVSVLSPRYVRSEWCIRELREFWRVAEQHGGVRVADKSRVFKVVKTPVPLDLHPTEVQGLLGYEFYQFDRSGRPVEFGRLFGSEAERQYWSKLNDVAYDIYQLLENLERQVAAEVGDSLKLNGLAEGEGERAMRSTSPVGAIATKPPIYLAETTFDLTDERDKIRRELQQRGHLVLPDQALPPYNPAFEQLVQENLERCRLSIHLIGSRYGIVPEGADRSLVELQHELAIAHSQNHPDFMRMLWMPVGLTPQEPRQEALLGRLQDDAELLQTSLEELKTLIQDRLNPRPQVPSGEKEDRSEDDLLRVYLICDQRDEEAIAPLDDFLYDQGFEVIRPLFDDDETQVRQDHLDTLQVCDAVMIYYGSGNEKWLRTKLGDLRKIAGYGRSRPMLAKAVYVTQPETTQKQQFRTREAIVIKAFGEFEPGLLEPFLTQIAQRQGG